MNSLQQLKFTEQGLIPVITQDAKTLQVLTLAYMNREAFDKTCETGVIWFYSRSRKKLWNKGESSGHFQQVKKILWDCDQDALLILVEPKGPACHTGASTCFFEEIPQYSE